MIFPGLTCVCNTVIHITKSSDASTEETGIKPEKYMERYFNSKEKKARILLKFGFITNCVYNLIAESHSRYKRSSKNKNKKSGNTSLIVSRDDIKREVQLALSSLACKVLES